MSLKPCGTRAAAVRHRRHGEDVCADCARAVHEYNQRWNKGQPTLKPCGTRAAAERHRKAGEQLCTACVLAERRYHREGYHRRRSMDTDDVLIRNAELHAAQYADVLAQADGELADLIAAQAKDGDRVWSYSLDRPLSDDGLTRLELLSDDDSLWRQAA